MAVAVPNEHGRGLREDFKIPLCSAALTTHPSNVPGHIICRTTHLTIFAGVPRLVLGSCAFSLFESLHTS